MGSGCWPPATRTRRPRCCGGRSTSAAAAEQPVRWVMPGNEWAVTVLEAAGLQLYEHGAVCVRGDVGPLAPYLPSAPFA